MFRKVASIGRIQRGKAQTLGRNGFGLIGWLDANHIPALILNHTKEVADAATDIQQTTVFHYIQGQFSYAAKVDCFHLLIKGGHQTSFVFLMT